MATNSVAISRKLVDSGLDREIADAVAESIVAHADDSHATKADIARVEGRLDNHSLLLKIIVGGIIAILLAIVTPKLTPAAPIVQPPTAEAPAALASE